jgi:hypothetical protein
MTTPKETVHLLIVAGDDETRARISRLAESLGLHTKGVFSGDVAPLSPDLLIHIENNRRLLDDILGLIGTDSVGTEQPAKSVACSVIAAKKADTSSETGKDAPPSTRKRSRQRTLAEVERDHILKTLDDTHGRCTAAAKILGINRTTLYRKMKAYGINRSMNDTKM